LHDSAFVPSPGPSPSGWQNGDWPNGSSTLLDSALFLNGGMLTNNNILATTSGFAFSEKNLNLVNNACAVLIKQGVP
jgi:hypothetical protein